MKIRTRLILAVASPLVMLCLLAANAIQESWNRSVEMDNIQRLGRFSTTVSALVHETQKERGATGGFLGSSDDSFRNKLKRQQELTDERRADFDTFMADFDPEEFGPKFAAQVETAMQKLHQLDKKRSEISKRSIPGGKAIFYFTDMHASFLDSITKSVLATSDGQIAVKLNAYSAFLKSKERAGVERAVMTNTFARDSFAPGVFEKFVSLVATQDSFLNEFLVLATPEDKEFLTQTMKGSDVDHVTSVRAVALQGASAESLGQDAVKWFDAATGRINLLKQVDDYLADNVNATVTGEAEAAHASLWTILLGTLALTVAVSTGGFLAIRSVLGRVATVKERIRDIAEGEGDLTHRLDTSSDEIGELCGWFNALLDKIETVFVRIASTSVALADSAEQLSSTAASLKSGAHDSKNQSTTIAEAIQEMSTNMVQTASASEEMSAGISGVAEATASIQASIGKIADRSGESASVAQSASDRVNCGNSQITELKLAAEEIGEVIDVIQEQRSKSWPARRQKPPTAFASGSWPFKTARNRQFRRCPTSTTSSARFVKHRARLPMKFRSRLIRFLKSRPPCNSRRTFLRKSPRVSANRPRPAVSSHRASPQWMEPWRQPLTAPNLLTEQAARSQNWPQNSASKFRSSRHASKTLSPADHHAKQDWQ